ncbi:MAG: hypothetical protein ABIJ48_09315 [Actinomycetota bacterium]
MAADLFNRAWELLEAERTPEQGPELLATALGPFHVGYACEALARAAAVAGNEGQRAAWLARAREQAAAVADEEERALLTADLDMV